MHDIPDSKIRFRNFIISKEILSAIGKKKVDNSKNPESGVEIRVKVSTYYEGERDAKGTAAVLCHHDCTVEALFRSSSMSVMFSGCSSNSTKSLIRLKAS